MNKDEDEIVIDSRPSDAIAVAMRAEAPIYVTANVLMNGAVSTDSAKDEEEAEELAKKYGIAKRTVFHTLKKYTIKIKVLG